MCKADKLSKTKTSHNLQKLDARLSIVANFVKDNLPVADIGCDHGKLSVHLALSGRVPHVIATDLNADPLSKAKLAAEKSMCLDKISFRLGNGLNILQENEVGTIVIAGVSAKTTVDILSDAPWLLKQNSPRLVLVPATKHHILREWLLIKGFDLVRDYPIKVADKWYTVIIAEFDKKPCDKTTPTIENIYLGKTHSEENFSEYAKIIYKHLQKKVLGLPANSQTAVEMKYFLEKYSYINTTD